MSLADLSAVRILRPSVLIVVLTVAVTLCNAQTAPANPKAGVIQQPSGEALLEETMDRAANLRLVRNRIQLVRDGAEALTANYPDKAAQLLMRALREVDRAEAELPANDPKHEEKLSELEFLRRPILLQLVHVNPEMALQALAAPQSADHDAEFQRLIFEAVAQQNPQIVENAALAKLGGGLSSTVVSAYAVLRQAAPALARPLATAMVQQLAQEQPGDDPEMLTATLEFLRQMRVDEGTRAPVVLIDSQALDPDSLSTLMNSLADQLLAASNPREAVIPQSLEAYIAAIEPYASDKAEKLREASAELTTSIDPTRTLDEPAGPPVVTVTADAGQAPDPGRAARVEANRELSAQLQEKQALLTKLEAQLRSAPNVAVARAVVQKAIDSTNSLIAFAAANAMLLEPECFDDGEYELYSFSPLITPINATNRLIVALAAQSPKSAVEAAAQYDHPEIELYARLALAEALMKEKASEKRAGDESRASEKAAKDD